MLNYFGIKTLGIKPQLKIWLTIFVYLSSLLVFVLVNSPIAKSANFVMQTGYYMGSGSGGLAISGIGFQPDFVFIKSTAATSAVFKTSAMPANTTAFTNAANDDTGTNITLDVDGFSLGTLANVNTANSLYHYIAVGGSDCSATGNFCVGSYTGNGTSPRTITTGFQPTMTIVKRSTNVLGHFRVASEVANETLFFDGTARDTAGNYIRSFSASGFSVGATDNANTGTYYYASFADTSGSFDEGTYTGNATDNRSITGVGFQPNFVLAKSANGNNANNRRPMISQSESYGDSSSYVADATTSATNAIQAMESDGFQIGTATNINRNADTYYFFAFGGASADTTSGSFTMNTGTYTGTGVANSKTNLGFRPDLVIVKASNATAGVFRTNLMKGDSTAYLDSATANLAGAITSLDADGFSVGTAAQTNSSGIVYYWQAFGSAYDPYDRDGANDFAIGAYYGNVQNDRNITRLPWQPNMVAIKRNGASTGVWRSSDLSGDLSSFFNATAESANYIQALNSDGFQLGDNAVVNTDASVNYWFAFKSGTNFAVGTYTGTGTAQNITSAGLRAENVWVKRSTAVSGVQKSVSLTGTNSQYFINTANVADRVTGFVKGGFSVGGNQTETNTSGGTYRYAAWNDFDYGTLTTDVVDASGNSVASPSFALSSSAINFDCSSITGSFGSASQRIRVSNFTTTPGWSLSIAATDGSTDLWENAGVTQHYDFNESSGSPVGCSDGGDTDTFAGKLNINASAGSLTPETGCVSTNVSLGTDTAFNEGVTNSIELMSASSSANADCYFELTSASIAQVLPREQAVDNYSINLTITVVAN